MVRKIIQLGFLLSCVAIVNAQDWTQWRGPNRDGVARDVLRIQQSQQSHCVLVRQAPDVRRDAPSRLDLVAFEDADGDVGVADIERQEHVHLSFRAAVYPSCLAIEQAFRFVHAPGAEYTAADTSS